MSGLDQFRIDQAAYHLDLHFWSQLEHTLTIAAIMQRAFWMSQNNHILTPESKSHDNKPLSNAVHMKQKISFPGKKLSPQGNVEVCREPHISAVSFKPTFLSSNDVLHYLFSQQIDVSYISALQNN